MNWEHEAMLKAVQSGELLDVHDERLDRLMQRVCDVVEGERPLRLLLAIEEYIRSWDGTGEPPAWLSRMKALVAAERQRRLRTGDGNEEAFDL